MVADRRSDPDYARLLGNNAGSAAARSDLPERLMKRLGGVAALLGVFTALIGIWFFFNEHSYAAAHPHTELAPILQWVGIAITLAGAGLFLIGLAVGYR